MPRRRSPEASLLPAMANPKPRPVVGVLSKLSLSLAQLTAGASDNPRGNRQWADSYLFGTRLAAFVQMLRLPVSLAVGS